jgi:hypothetical protein
MPTEAPAQITLWNPPRYGIEVLRRRTATGPFSYWYLHCGDFKIFSFAVTVFRDILRLLES